MLSLFFLGALAASLSIVIASTTDRPTIDLGYTIHRANPLRGPNGYYNFSNIRFGESTEGPRRFLAPVPVQQTRNTTIEDGLIGRVCPQALPNWDVVTAQIFDQDYLTGQQFTPLPGNATTPQAEDPRASEDCLFLDVIVPQSIWNSSKQGQSNAPVVVWIYGGGYTFGDKSYYDPVGPSGLLANSPEPFIWVAMNYRLGAFGFLGGPTVEASATVQPGLLDQRLALDWVQKHISKFGGSPDRVTVMGESAGAGSILYQITAYAGKKGPVPFSRAILQSTAIFIKSHPDLIEEQTQALLQRCNVSSIEELRKLPASSLIAANRDLVAQSSYGFFYFGPSIDASFAPALPAVLLARGEYDHSIDILLGHNSDEGLLFTSPASNQSTGLSSFIQQHFSEMPPSTQSELLTSIYPETAFAGREAFIDRTKQLIGDAYFNCNSFFLRTAFQEKSSAYEFAIPPGIHGSDLAYTFAGKNKSSLTTPQIVNPFQKFLANFATRNSHHELSSKHSGNFTIANATMHVFAPSGVMIAPDNTVNDRCRFWLSAQIEGNI